jgi:hypothetical protein
VTCAWCTVAMGGSESFAQCHHLDAKCHDSLLVVFLGIAAMSSMGIKSDGILSGNIYAKLFIC